MKGFLWVTGVLLVVLVSLEVMHVPARRIDIEVTTDAVVEKPKVPVLAKPESYKNDDTSKKDPKPVDSADSTSSESAEETTSDELPTEPRIVAATDDLGAALSDVFGKLAKVPTGESADRETLKQLGDFAYQAARDLIFKDGGNEPRSAEALLDHLRERMSPDVFNSLFMISQQMLQGMASAMDKEGTEYAQTAAFRKFQGWGKRLSDEEKKTLTKEEMEVVKLVEQKELELADMRPYDDVIKTFEQSGDKAKELYGKVAPAPDAQLYEALHSQDAEGMAWFMWNALAQRLLFTREPAAETAKYRNVQRAYRLAMKWRLQQPSWRESFSNYKGYAWSALDGQEQFSTLKDLSSSTEESNHLLSSALEASTMHDNVKTHIQHLLKLAKAAQVLSNAHINPEHLAEWNAIMTQVLTPEQAESLEQQQAGEESTTKHLFNAVIANGFFVTEQQREVLNLLVLLSSKNVVLSPEVGNAIGILLATVRTAERKKFSQKQAESLLFNTDEDGKWLDEQWIVESATKHDSIQKALKSHGFTKLTQLVLQAKLMPMDPIDTMWPVNAPDEAALRDTFNSLLPQFGDPAVFEMLIKALPQLQDPAVFEMITGVAQKIMDDFESVMPDPRPKMGNIADRPAGDNPK